MTDLDPIIEMLSELSNDTAVPRNVRTKISDAKKKLVENEDKVAAMSSAVYDLDAVSNDINMPAHARTLIWNILSELEALKEEELKG
ncbi:hypothetical protein COX85_01215 [Candidatus Micrarchaeota archaeon CG_4_10_14_0_2_um_filter_55_9]|nr:MAG: hypothetical protein AUJ15_00400 [Candidatus Micrarchaeota archaeon CG1_02_55_41]PIO02547.1 MAG: hypothetical protein COT57_03255 [Candidatus Micrarchaeota archaeon CG09_land_8_20_14_0_10_55_25]PIZ91925.1 MAG: hypothetical protein COX85_01215 [Candidatus Micrarchaeota archaeon CG_4_10_14_0_2_um_filter_55_9]PJD01617.1 MAG: hypothetical protein COU38_00025 [Candidatus Micrarchaeota archaeon CG10_big_fil_rev_8_21_14_0_10_54_18]